MGVLARLSWPSDTHAYCWRWSLASPPEALWPFVAETNRFNRDVGLPAVEGATVVEKQQAHGGANVPRRRLSFVRLGVPVEWIEEPFEWAFGRRFGALRRYSNGPFAEVRTQVDLEPTSDGGTLASYRLTAKPRNLLGHLAIPVNLGWRSGRSFEEAFRRYDAAVQAGPLAVSLLPSQVPELPPGAAARLDQGIAALTTAGSPATHLAQLRTTIETGTTWRFAVCARTSWQMPGRAAGHPTASDEPS